jgi:hypothetical protein
MASNTRHQRWQFPMDGRPSDDLPSSWDFATAAVSRDLRYRRHGRPISFDGVAWDLTANTDGSMYIGIARLTDGADVGGFARGAGYAVDTTSGQAAVWLAETIQDELAGYEFVQWPMAGQRLLRPTLRDGQAQWDASTNTVVAPIGGLCDVAHQAN